MNATCENCHAKLKEEALFCHKCGREVMQNEVQEIILECKNCGQKNSLPYDSIFHVRCGKCKNKLFTTQYDVLEVGIGASQEEIKKQYKLLALQWHPDKNPRKESEANEKMTKINEAYSILSNTEKREKYDLSLDEKIENVKNYILNKQQEDQEYETSQNKDDMKDIYDYAMEMAFYNDSQNIIMYELMEIGVPRETAKKIAKECVDKRKKIVRKDARKSLIEALIWIIIMLAIAGVVYFYFIKWRYVIILLLFPGYKIIKKAVEDLGQLITGKVPL